MKHLAAVIALFVISMSTSALAREKLIVTNERSGDVTIIDPDTKQTLATIPVGRRPRGLCVTQDGKFAYIAVSATAIAGPPDARGQESKKSPETKPTESKPAPEGIAVIDLVALKMIDLIPCGRDPECVSLSRDEKTAYVSNEDDNAASIVDLASKKIIKTVKVGEEPEGVTTSHDGKFVYVACESTHQLAVIATDRDERVAWIETSSRPRAVAFTGDDATAYVSCEQSGVISIVDVSTKKVRKEIRLQGTNMRPMGVAVSPDGKRVYVGAGRSGTLVVIDAVRDAVVETIPNVGDRVWGVAVSSDGRFIFTANGPSNDVSIIDASTLKIVAKLKAGGSPWAVAVAR